MEDRVIAMHPVSLFPGVYLFPGQLLRILEATGLGVQLQPIATFDKNLYQALIDENIVVVSYEGPWNERSVHGVDTDIPPTLIDKVVFGRARVWGNSFWQSLGRFFNGGESYLSVFERLYPSALHVVHSLDEEGDVVELVPEMGVTRGKIATGDYPVCIDTYHLRRPGSNGESPICDGIKQVVWLLNRLVSQGRIKLIHAQPDRENPDINGYLRGSSNNLLRELLRLMKGTDCPAVIETKPILDRLPERFLIEMTERIREDLDS